MRKLILFLKILLCCIGFSIQRDQKFISNVKKNIFLGVSELRALKKNLEKITARLSEEYEINNRIKKQLKQNSVFNQSYENFKEMRYLIERTLQEEEEKIEILLKSINYNENSYKKLIRICDDRRASNLKKIDDYINMEEELLKKIAKFQKKVVNNGNRDKIIDKHRENLNIYKTSFDHDKIRIKLNIETLGNLQLVEGLRLIKKYNQLIKDRNQYCEDYRVFIARLLTIYELRETSEGNLCKTYKNLKRVSKNMIEGYISLKKNVNEFYNEIIMKYVK